MWGDFAAQNQIKKEVRNGERKAIAGSATEHQKSSESREKKTHNCASSKIDANGPW